MLPRRRLVAPDIEHTEHIEAPPDTYSKLDKRGSRSAPPPPSRVWGASDVTRAFEPSYPETEDPFGFTESGSSIREVVMAARDRSAEFAATVRSLQGRTLARPQIRDERKAAALQTYSQFMSIAKVISRNISSTYAKLEKLAILAKKKSLFDDRPGEIQELTYIIKGDLSSLNQQIARLGEMPRGRNSLHSHSSSVVVALQSRLATMSNHFKQVLEVRSENLKHQNSRREQFTRGAPAARETPSMLLPQEQVSIELGDGGGGRGEGLQQVQQYALRDDTDTYVQQRAETMHNIESTIVELGGIFQQLAHMVKEQDEAIGRIDSNIQEAELNVEAAHTQILKHFQSVTGNRALMLKIFGVLIFFFIFFVVVMA